MYGGSAKTEHFASRITHKDMTTTMTLSDAITYLGIERVARILSDDNPLAAIAVCARESYEADDLQAVGAYYALTKTVPGSPTANK